ncbi:MFS transporter [Paenibacillus doosanensis]|uniref:Tetracycline resistance protein, class B n=1 Tax=Paenibacillus konkukensis TaxID=2020716 RepID=A0ABY4RVP8_9BACL|nr:MULTISPECIES: MFS transporter [Paenibacillus]MCS7463674.1 MFS transporter [Paenibacillus doosanensis]UQZ85835.1 Tetracycline resistance protein, class B [Paenibacillus konkukensis]
MEAWKRNLYILWFGTFFSSAGIGMIIPFLPLYVQELGIHDVQKAALWAAMIFGINHLMIALVSPFWGKFSDKYGQKVTMVRAGLGSAIIIAAMGLVHTPLQLLLLRGLFGTMGGFSVGAVALMAIETPKEQVGKVLGTLQTGQVTGQLLGPLLGGILAEWLGMRNSFFFTGICLFIAGLLVLFGVHEKKKYPKFRFQWRRGQAAAEAAAGQSGAAGAKFEKVQLKDVVKQAPVILTLFVSTFLISVSFQSISPIITLYVKSMHIENHVEIMAGLIFASSALGTMISAPILGRIGDRYGYLNVLLCCLLLISILYIPQARITDPWVLMGARFLSGLCVGGLIPSISSLLRSLTPKSIQGSVFSYNASASSLGNVSGSLFGGIVASHMGISVVFYIISGVFLLHFVMLAAQAKRINRTSESRQSAV